MWYVYLIRHTVTKQIYIGFTKSFNRRIKEHNENKSKATYRKSGKWIPIYIEVFRNRQDAIDREKRFKQHGNAKRELLKRIKRSLVLD